MVRKHKLWLLGAGAVVVLAGMPVAFSDPLSFDVHEYTLVVPGLHPAHDGLRVLQISDPHLGLSTPDDRIRAAIRATNQARPDLVLLTGDYVTFSKKRVVRIGDVLGGLTAPTYAVLGNHDHWVNAAAVRQELEQLGYTVLSNEVRQIELREAPLWIIGIDDGHTHHDDVTAALRGVPGTGTRLVLAHTPPTADRLPPDAQLLVFSGHTHGGQIRIPGITPRIARSMGQPYLQGLYQVGTNQLYVNRGLGHGRGGLAIRIGVRPEIALFTLRSPAT